MMWFKFLIYFQLFAAALLNVINALSVLKGTHLQGFAEEFYAQSYALKMADNFYGICLIVLAVLCIVVRFRLAGFYSNGPGLYIMLLVANILVPLVYGFLLTNAGSISIEVYTGWYRDTVTYQFDGWASLFGSAIGSGVLLICNGIYFNKRKELFRF